MRKYWVVVGIGVVCACFSAYGLAAQELVLGDTLSLMKFSDRKNPSASPIRLRFTQELEYSLTFSNLIFINWQQEKNANQITLLQNLQYRSKLDNDRNFKLINQFVHNLGMQFFFDSINKIQLDDNTLETRLEFKAAKNLSFSLTSLLTTRFFNGFDNSVDDQNQPIKILTSSFLTPMIWMISTGIAWEWPSFGSINLGISSAKLTYIRDSKVFNTPGITAFYGVPKDRRSVFDYGWTLRLLIDKVFLKRVHWTCDFLVFQNFHESVDLNVRNLLNIRITKFLKTNIQTRLFYQEQVSKQVQLENLVSIGFSITL